MGVFSGRTQEDVLEQGILLYVSLISHPPLISHCLDLYKIPEKILIVSIIFFIIIFWVVSLVFISEPSLQSLCSSDVSLGFPEALPLLL